ncbi:hypothetical protein IF1G_11439 [Cordyceps javanica]|uniref:Uncharacterized protein n=1 Tax=Cordyceps javanica TaxID=43265 RepID=A0A545UKA7_9HYPO|nr:hypothetical protein IF1G_11439 [Cordyceps javanica]
MRAACPFNYRRYNHMRIVCSSAFAPSNSVKIGDLLVHTQAIAVDGRARSLWLHEGARIACCLHREQRSGRPFTVGDCSPGAPSIEQQLHNLRKADDSGAIGAKPQSLCKRGFAPADCASTKPSLRGPIEPSELKATSHRRVKASAVTASRMALSDVPCSKATRFVRYSVKRFMQNGAQHPDSEVSVFLTCYGREWRRLVLAQEDNRHLHPRGEIQHYRGKNGLISAQDTGRIGLPGTRRRPGATMRPKQATLLFFPGAGTGLVRYWYGVHPSSRCEII